MLKVTVAELTFCIKRKKKIDGEFDHICLAGQELDQTNLQQFKCEGRGEGWKIGGAFAHNFCLAGQEVVGSCSKLIEAQHEGCIKYIFY